jgi:hypothetical protein
MKKLLISASVLLSIACLSVASAPTEWQQRYDTLIGLTKAKNVKAFKQYFDPSFVSVSPKGKVTTRAEFVKEFEGAFAISKSVDANLVIKEVKDKGALKNVGFDFHITLHTKKGNVNMHEVGIDTWSHKSGNWLIVKTVDSSFTSGMTK